MYCEKDHKNIEILKGLKVNQGGEERHKCAGCAYIQGFEHGINGVIKKPDWNSIPFNQGGIIRHKDALEAYNLGYSEGKLKRGNN